MSKQNPPNNDTSLADEFRAFLLVAAVLVPVLTVTVIVGYGFSVWISQMFLGPPGH